MRCALPWLVLAVACSGGDDQNCTKEIPYDGIDQDCNGSDLNDRDGDGYIAVEAGGDDCDDGSANINPDAVEVPYDNFDQDCADGDLRDVDGDGFDAAQVDGPDCDDDDPDVNPDAVDPVGDGADQNCDGIDGTDVDGDGFQAPASGGDDCDDADPTVFPGAEDEWYDGVDQDCDGACDYDQDGDGAVLAGTEVVDGDLCDTDPDPGSVGVVEDCNDLDEDAVDISVVATYPADGAVDVSPVEVVSFTLSQADPAATVVVYDDLGITVPGTTTRAGADVIFEADGAYELSRTYTAEITHGCGGDAFDFTIVTSAIPIDVTSLPGRVWELNVGDGNFVVPKGVGPILAPLVDLPLLLTVVDEDVTTMDLRVAPTAASGIQDLCVVTTDIPDADLTLNPTFTFGPADLTANISGVVGTLTGLTGTATFSADTSRIDNLVLDGNIDTRPLVEVLSPGGSPNTVCLLLLASGSPCQPCPDGSGTFCLDFVVDDLDAVEVVGGAVVPRTTLDILTDPSCP